MKLNRKIRAWWGLCLFLLFGAGCGDDEAPADVFVPYLSVEQAGDKTVGAADSVLVLSVRSNVDWYARSSAAWCKVASDTLFGDAELKISIEQCLGTEARTATVGVYSTSSMDKLKMEFTLTQQAPVFVEGGHYTIPVVFQVLYADASDEKQYIRPGHLQTVLDEVNRLYRESGPDLGLEFVMAAEDPEGNPLDEPGVHRVQWDEEAIDCSRFMVSRDRKYLDLIWNPDVYMNIMVYRFTESYIAGIAQFPFLAAPDYLEGCEVWAYGVPVQANLNRPQCVSINSDCIYEMSGTLTPDNRQGTTGYAPEVIAHELGHYLGLRHTFSESFMGCADTDYCADTPTYDRTAYERLFNSFGNYYMFHLNDLVTREDCLTGEEYVSDNLMDYYISYSNAFTDGQAARIRYILEHGVFVPGPKDRSGAAPRSRAEGMLDLPIEIMKCLR